jgi:arylsulfatase A-like enzyme
VPEASVSAAAAARWLTERESRETTAPFFLFWHTYEPHGPYTDERFVGAQAALPPGVDESARDEWQRYLGDVAVADRALGGILDTLEQLGLRENTDVIVFSDHGEEFGEHSDGGLGPHERHGHGSWDTLLRVPLVVASPSVPPGRRDEQVSLVDIFPTLLACAEVTPPRSHGRALQVPGGHDSVGAEALNPQWAAQEEKTWRTSGGLKYLARLGEPPTEHLWELGSDPLEERDIADLHADELAALRDEALAFFASAPEEWAARTRSETETPGDLPPAVLESLKSLGYVE